MTVRSSITGPRLAAATVVALALAAIAVVALGESSTDARAGGASRTARVDAAIRGVLRRYHVPGAIVGIWQRGEQPIVKGYGVRKLGGAAMTPDLHMRIGSETKTFTGTAILQLVDEGKVGLDDPVAKYVKGVPGGRGITIRDLGEMRSGLVDYAVTRGWTEAFVRDPRRQWRPRQLLAHSFRQPSQFSPGSRFAYSNTNFVLLGLVIEAASGEPVARYVSRHVLAPLELDHTSFSLSGFPAPHASGYTDQTATGRVADATGWSASWAGSAGVMTSTVHDLRTWARAAATGSLLRPGTQRRRERFRPTDLGSTRYGFALFEVNGWVGHNGSIPGYESLVVYLPAERATMVVLVNSNVNPKSGQELSTLLGRAITGVITPDHVFSFG